MNKQTRREFLRISAIGAAGAVAAACGEPQVVERVVKETVVVEKEVEKEVTKEVEVVKEITKRVIPTVVPTKYNESPMLTERVEAGELEPVDERLPEEPLVVYPYEEIGQYGGTIRVGSLASGLYGGDADQLSQPQNMLRITPDLTGAVPNVLKDWEVSDDFTEITCWMRKGMRWSDGELLTVDGFLFWYEDILLNEELTPVLPQWFRPGGEVMKLERLDDYSFRITFAIPSPSFIMVNMAHKFGFWDGTFKPRHYMEQFHIKYNPKADELAEEAGFDHWYQYFNNRISVNQNIERPNLRSFIPVKDTPEQVFFERNPYFWMVDPEGNQLPYFDEMVHNRVADLSMLDAKVVGGQYDFAGHNTRIQNYPTYQDAAEQGDFHILLWRSGKGAEVHYEFNCNWEMEAGIPTDQQEPNMMREIFWDDRWRYAMSLAINRDEINDVIYYGNATPRAFTVIPSSRHFKPEAAAAYADYDPDQANALLDELGLEWDESGEYRLWPDGSPLELSFDYADIETPKTPITELVTEYWSDVGVKINYKSVTRNLLSEKVLANEEPVSLWHGGRTTDVLFLRSPQFWAPKYGDESCWGVLWGLWYNTLGEEGVEPPDAIKDLYNMLDEYLMTDSDEAAEKVIDNHTEHIWNIGTVGNAPHPLIVSNRLGNLTDDGYWVWDALWTWPVWPEQWYLKSS